MLFFFYRCVHKYLLKINIHRIAVLEFYGDLVYKFKKLIGRKEGLFFSVQKNQYTLQTYRL